MDEAEMLERFVRALQLDLIEASDQPTRSRGDGKAGDGARSATSCSTNSERDSEWKQMIFLQEKKK
jgi:hypothetical protein